MILLGDCMERLKELEPDSVDAVVTDPPYGWRFMGKAWDDADILIKSRQAKRPGETYVGADGVTRQTRDDASMAAGKYDQTLKGNEAFAAWTEEYARELLRVMKPGAHALIFCGPRTYHAMAFGVERAGFEIRDQLQWIFGSGFPKSLNIEKAMARYKSPEAYRYKGWGTALKPSNEPIVLARKPLSEKTVAANVLKWGVGGLNIDESRIGLSPNEDPEKLKARSGGEVGIKSDGYVGGTAKRKQSDGWDCSQGRWPANLLLDEAAAEMLDEQSGPCKTGVITKPPTQDAEKIIKGKKPMITASHLDYASGASRFFYVAKTSKRERNAGLEGMPEKDAPGSKRSTPAEGRASALGAPRANHHPTVKPLKLMEYLCKLITPPGGVILDPFMGSGSTGVAAFRLGYKFIGIEMNEEYCAIAEKRIAHARAAL